MQWAGERGSLELPTAKPRPAIRSFKGGRQAAPLGGELTAAAQQLSRQENLSVFMVLLAAFVVLLHRYSGQEDLLVGTPVAGRERVEIEGLIGFFVNTLVVRSNLAGDPTAKAVLDSVRETIFEAHAHQEVPFEKLVAELQPDRDLNQMPLVQVIFRYQPQQRETLRMGGVEMKIEELETGTSNFDLAME